MRYIAILLACSFFAVAHTTGADEPQVAVFDAAGELPGNRHLIKTYRVEDLPVWNNDKTFNPSLLMQLIRLSVSPPEWKFFGGKSIMVPYAKTASLVISAPENSHDDILKLIKSLRAHQPKDK